MLIGLVALHLLLILWAMRTYPYVMRPAESLVVVQLNALSDVVFADRHKRDVAPKQAFRTPASRQKPLNHPRDDAPAGGIDRALVAEAHQRSGSSDTSLPESSALSATLDAVAGAVPANHAPGGSGSIYGRFRPPQVIHRARLAYPKAAIMAEQHGDVDVLITVSAEGKLLDASIDKSSGSSALDQASLDSIRLYEFKAAEKDGAPVQAQAIINIEWQISARERYEFSRLPKPHPDINLDAQLRSVEFLDSVPTRRQACDHMKNPDCLASPTDD